MSDQRQSAQPGSATNLAYLGASAFSQAIYHFDGDEDSAMNKVEDGTAAEWKHLYEAAVLELDRTRLASRIEEARRAILQRLENTDATDRAHTEPLTNALQVLQDLSRIGSGDGKFEVA